MNVNRHLSVIAQGLFLLILLCTSNQDWISADWKNRSLALSQLANCGVLYGGVVKVPLFSKVRFLI